MPDGRVPATAFRLGEQTRAPAAQHDRASQGGGRGERCRVWAQEENLSPEDRAGAPAPERLSPAVKGPERMDTTIRARRRRAHKSVERIDGSAAALGGVVALILVADSDRGEPASKLDRAAGMVGNPRVTCGRTPAGPP